MILLQDYWMGRDAKYPDEFTDVIQGQGAEVVRRVNSILAAYEEASGIPLPLNAVGTHVASGWRPAAVNEATSNAASHSKHLSAQACDVYDPNRELARWCVENEDVLKEVGVWCEDFRWTPTWAHFQIVPPGSGKRIYVPSTKPPLIGAP